MNVKIINKSRNPLPSYETEGSAGMDVRVDLSTHFDDLQCWGKVQGMTDKKTKKRVVKVYPNTRVLFPTGLYFEIPQGYQISARPRSGLAIKKGVTLINAVGLIDSDYRGEMMIGIINLGQQPVWIEDGERICQILLEPVHKIEWEEVDTLSETVRGKGGFGSTGK